MGICKFHLPEYDIYQWKFVVFTSLLTFPCFLSLDDVDTRAITRRLRQDGSLVGVLSTDDSRSDEDLLEMAKNWKIVGKSVFSLLQNR
jgi:carbamoylphosphate synthase small subunit